MTKLQPLNSVGDQSNLQVADKANSECNAAYHL